MRQIRQNDSAFYCLVDLDWRACIWWLPPVVALVFIANYLGHIAKSVEKGLTVPPNAIRVIYVCPHHDKPNAFREPLPDLAWELDKLLVRKEKKVKR